MTKNRRKNHAVSEVLSTALLLGITIALFGFLNYIVFSFSFEPSAPSVSLIGSIDKANNNITIEHNGGKPLTGDTKIIITIGNTTYQKTATELLSKNSWNFSDTVQFHYLDNITNRFVQVVVMDPASNTLLLSVVLQQGQTISGGNFIWNYDTVDSATSNLDSTPDKGIESIFSNAQSTTIDGNVMTIQESEYGNQIHDEVVDSASSNVDSSPDKGTETNFANVQGISPDTNLMTIEESNYGSTAVNENDVVTGFTATGDQWTKTGTSPYLGADDASNYISTSKGNQDTYWWIFANTSATGNGFTTTLWIDFDAGDGNDDCTWYVDTNNDNTPETSGTIDNPTNAYVSISLGTYADTSTEINNARVWFKSVASAGMGPMTIDYVYINVQRAAITNYNIDLEYQWTTANYLDASKSVCLYVSSHPTGTENLQVYYRSGTSWTSLGTITTTGWNNFTAAGLTSGIYTIRLLGVSESSDTIQDTWTIDCIFLHTYNLSNYQIDLEYQWTNAQYLNQGKTICMYLTSHTGGTENLDVNYWNGMTWANLGTISSNGWNNMTATGLISPIYTIQLIGSTEAADTTQDTWTIDCLFLQSFSYS